MGKGFSRFYAPLILAVVAFVLTYTAPFSSSDNFICDELYSRLRQTSRDIVIIKIDEKTLDELGSFTSWSRDKVSDVLDYLYSDEANRPMAVGIDINFQGSLNEEADLKLVDACKNRDVIVPSPIVFNGKVQIYAEGISFDSFNVGMVERPFSELRPYVRSGFTNVFLGLDSISRYHMAAITYKGERVNSFSYEVASLYAQKRGIEIGNINTDSNGIFRFFYAGKPGEFSNVSFINVLNGEIPVSEFRDKIVLIGAYATGMQDHYLTAYDVGGNMYGVEMQANIIQAIVDGATAVNVNGFLYSSIFALGVFIFTYLIAGRDLWALVVLPVLGMAVHLIGGKVLSYFGYLIPQIYCFIIVIVSMAYYILNKYVVEASKRRHAMRVFGRYMDPSLVEKLVSENKLEFELGGNKRDIAVLFVDIRGFTSMSESLQPEEVVGILNEYLSMVAECIFNHHGMLDKFIGDAAMAVFNAPVNLDDYKYEAVATAYDIVKRSDELSSKLMEKFGKTVSYGIGVHAGPAVVGNIGSSFRMDYTAIGDTVNTASRLESNAKRGEVLISESLMNDLAGRIIVEEAGPMKFKGKAKEMNVYRLKGLVAKDES